MRHIQSIQLIRDVLIEARGELVKAMMKDPASPIHYIDHTPNILHKIDDALKECDSYSINKG
jgi:hypothetical protein